jgi:hypothetical protein
MPKIGQKLRSEQEIFDELEGLCASPGYVHAIAFLCFRDSLIRYQGEMTSEDMKHMFSREHLVRTEISTLVGLLVKADIDYSLPAPAITQQHLERTEELLEELHRAMGMSPLAGVDLKEAIAKGINPFSTGDAFREAIFYSGESGYAFQYRDFAVKKYAADNAWLTSHKYLSIEEAREVVTALSQFRTNKIADVAYRLNRSDPSEWSLLPGFCFTVDELSTFSGIKPSIVGNVLAAFALAPGERNQGFRFLHDFNAANATPLLRRDAETYLLFQEYSLAEALYESPFYWMCGDLTYLPTAMFHRGQFTEAFSRELLERVFGRRNVHLNVDIYESKCKRLGEIDVLVLFGNRAIVLQAKAKKLTLEARKGNDNQLKDDFKKSVQESYDQAHECAEWLGKPNLRFVTGSQELKVPKTLKNIYIFCVVSDNYPALAFQARQFLSIQKTAVIRPPFVMDIFTLDVMAEMLDSPLYFLSYVDKRTSYADKIIASHELVLLSQHLKRNLWFEDKYDWIQLDDDISADLNIAMSVRRDNVPGKRIPDGILTRIANTSVGRLLKEIETRAEPETLDLGFLLLKLGENAVLKISKAMDVVAERARLDGQGHDVTMPLNEAGAGLTIHCNDTALASAGPSLLNHCTARKYKTKTDEWHGLCLWPRDGTVRFGVSLNYKWKQNTQMDQLTSGLQKPTPFEDLFTGRKRKIGRNDPCPCNSGRKYKKCHGK